MTTLALTVNNSSSKGATLGQKETRLAPTVTSFLLKGNTFLSPRPKDYAFSHSKNYDKREVQASFLAGTYPWPCV
ncbi:MAG TPA: hypothetical protein VGB71_01120 [Flavisolibacter sp.]